MRLRAVSVSASCGPSFDFAGKAAPDSHIRVRAAERRAGLLFSSVHYFSLIAVLLIALRPQSAGRNPPMLDVEVLDLQFLSDLEGHTPGTSHPE